MFARMCGIASLVLASGAAHAQVASALVREGDLIEGENVTSINNSAANGIGGWAFTINTQEVETISRVFGNLTGGVGSTIRKEGTFFPFQQTSYESFFGIGNASVGYGVTADNIEEGSTSLDAVWRDDTPIQTENDAVGSAFSTFNSRPSMTDDGQLAWVGGLTAAIGGSTQTRHLFLDGVRVIGTGDAVPGLGVISSDSIDFDYRVSELGTDYLAPIDFDTGSSANDIALVRGGAALMAGGGFVREGDAVPASVGGLAGENWSSFDFMGINEAGDVFFTGDTSGPTATDEFVFQNGQIVLREGDSAGGFVISGSIEGGDQNTNGDWGVIWDIDTPGGTIEALIVNGDLLLKEGDLVDWNNDGLVDALDTGAAIENFTGISALSLGDRQGGVFDVLFTADVRLDTGALVEGGFRLRVPTPGGAAVLGVGALLASRRRR